MANSDFPSVQDYTEDYPTLLRSIIRIIRNVMKGKTNNAYSCTLTASSATTTVTLSDGDLGPLSTILFMPLTANAATEFGAGTIYVSAIDSSNNQFTITHANNAQTDRNFRFVVIG